MQSSVYRKVEGDFSIKRQHAQSDARHFKKNVYDENPKLAEIEDKINKLKEKLDALVIANAPYEEIYKVSRELDTYISEYYREKGA